MPVLLALHAALASGQAWRGLRTALPEATILAPDLPGHGGTPAPAPAPDFMDVALEQVLASLPPDPVHVLGHSYGGALALRLLVDVPDRIRSLTVFEPVLFAAAASDVLARHREEMGPFMVAVRKGDLEGAGALFTDIWGDGTQWDQMPGPARAYISDRIGLIPRTEPGLMDDVHDILPRLAVDGPPVCLVQRADPPRLVASIMEGLQARLPNARRATLGMDHMAPLRDPVGMAALLRQTWGD